jgi:cytochrome c oxidase subunit 1
MYNKLFTLHGVIMIFFFLIPSIPATLGNFLLPIMIGAKDLAFPAHQPAELVHLRRRRAHHARGGLRGGLDTGWTFYTPYSSIASETPSRPRRSACSSPASRRSSPAATSSSPCTACARRA